VRAPQAAARRCRKAGLGFTALDACEAPAPFQVRNLHGPCHADRSDRARHALERLHREHRFDLIEFAAHGGLGFRAVQAKRAGLAFDDVCLAVRLDACGPWLRDQEQRWPSGLEDLEVDFAERHSFEHADVPVAPCPALLDYVRRLGWAVRADALAGPGAYVEPTAPPSPGAGGARPLVTVAVTHYNLGRYLPVTLASLAAQTYPHLEVLVVDDGSTDGRSVEAFEAMRARHPGFGFLRQPNAGVAAARNRALGEARGEYFLPVDADNLARPDMVERFVAAARRNPDLSALACYFLAFEDGDEVPERFVYAYRPTGGPHTLASIRNAYGDTNALFRTADFRAVGGFEIDRGTSTEDWEAFVKLVHTGRRVGVVPDHLFYYRHREAGFSRVTNAYANHRRVLRQFVQLERLPPDERAVLWSALVGFQRHLEQLADRQRCLRYRLADGLHALCARAPWAMRGLKWALLSGGRVWGRLAGLAR
jgi:glycosyltransferase involved in cell wall biosynthesis